MLQEIGFELVLGSLKLMLQPYPLILQAFWQKREESERGSYRSLR